MTKRITIKLPKKFLKNIDKLTKKFINDFLDLTEELLNEQKINNGYIRQLFRAELLLLLTGAIQQTYVEACWASYSKVCKELAQNSPSFSNLREKNE